jgi:hypothetical protein
VPVLPPFALSLVDGGTLVSIVIKLVPKLSACAFIKPLKPSPAYNTITTVAIPITTPSVVNAVLTLLAIRA